MVLISTIIPFSAISANKSEGQEKWEFYPEEEHIKTLILRIENKAMKKTIHYTTQGVCSVYIDITVEDGIVRDVYFEGGCNGNLQGISLLVKSIAEPSGIPFHEAVSVPQGVQYSHIPEYGCLNSQLPEDSIVLYVYFEGGCNGNLQGISLLVKGMKIDDVIERLEGVHCGSKATSCPDQFARALKKLKSEN